MAPVAPVQGAPLVGKGLRADACAGVTGWFPRSCAHALMAWPIATCDLGHHGQSPLEAQNTAAELQDPKEAPACNLEALDQNLGP